ncbi:hypothetical protein D3C78_1267680 [compost metagenome]
MRPNTEQRHRTEQCQVDPLVRRCQRLIGYRHHPDIATGQLKAQVLAVVFGLEVFDPLDDVSDGRRLVVLGVQRDRHRSAGRVHQFVAKARGKPTPWAICARSSGMVRHLMKVSALP